MRGRAQMDAAASQSCGGEHPEQSATISATLRLEHHALHRVEAAGSSPTGIPSHLGPEARSIDLSKRWSISIEAPIDLIEAPVHVSIQVIEPLVGPTLPHGLHDRKR